MVEYLCNPSPESQGQEDENFKASQGYKVRLSVYICRRFNRENERYR